MNVTVVTVGFLQCNCYLIEIKNEVLVVDPGDELEKILEKIANKKVIGIILTHRHFDHIGCVEELRDRYNVLVYDYTNLREGKHQLGSFNFEVIYTLGHTMDSITFYFEENKFMCTGDFLFYDTIGRCDFEDSDYQEMLKSIEKIKKYPDDIIIYPGHGPLTNLGREKKYNPYFNR